MKKLIIALAAVAFAAFAQAATVDWKLSSKNTIKTYSGGDGAGITVYLVNAVAGTAYDTFVSGLANGSVTAANIESNALYMDKGTTGTSGASLGKYTAGKATVASPGVDYTVAFVYFEKVGDVDYYYLSGTQTAKSYDGSAEYPSGTAAQWGSAAYSQANWHAVSTSGGGESVPEPTSGLLMLIGAAGLALRRKRA